MKSRDKQPRIRISVDDDGWTEHITKVELFINGKWQSERWLEERTEVDWGDPVTQEMVDAQLLLEGSIN
jgi:hypothetical protein